MFLTMFFLALIGIVSFSLAVFSSHSTYYQVPLVVLGKVYANSMLVLINSRMVLGSEETPTPSVNVSVMRFGTAPANIADGL